VDHLKTKAVGSSSVGATAVYFLKYFIRIYSDSDISFCFRWLIAEVFWKRPMHS